MTDRMEFDEIQLTTIARTIERVRELEMPERIMPERISAGRAVEIACLEYLSHHLLCGTDTEEHPKKEPMESTNLMSRSGSELVTTVSIPPFDPRPEVIAWGLRVFVLHKDGDYREVFCYCVPTEVTE